MSPTTANPWIFDTICLVVGWGAILLGSFCACRAVIGEGAKGRRRCPKCWYDMAGVPGLQCPECGRAARNEFRLEYRRRRWRAGAGWTLVIVLGIAGTLTPRMSRHGLVGAIPTTALVWWSPVSHGPQSVMVKVMRALNGRRDLSAVEHVPWGEQMEGEAWSRVIGGDAWAWQSRALMDRWLAKGNSSIRDFVEVPLIWRLDKPVPVYVWTRSAYPFNRVIVGPPGAAVPDPTGRRRVDRIEVTPTVIETPSGSKRGRMRVREPISFEMDGQIIPLGYFDATFDCVGPGQPVVRSVDDYATTQLVKAALDPRLVGEELVIGGNKTPKLWDGIHFAICVQIRVMLDGVCVGTGEPSICWVEWANQPTSVVTWKPGGLEALLASPQRASVVVTGSSEFPEKEYSGFSPELPEAWTGTFEVPLRVDATKLWGK